MSHNRVTIIFLLGILGIVTSLNTLDYKLEKVEASPKSVLGEGPHWDHKSQSLYYVDIFGNKCSVLRYCLAEEIVYCAKIPGQPVVTFIIPVAGTKDQFVVGLSRAVGVIRWDGKSRKAILLRIVLPIEHCSNCQNNIFNDAKADPGCRLFAGTKRSEACADRITPTYGNLYRVGGGEPTLILNKPKSVRISNGLAWSTKLNKFYYIDSCAYNIKEYDWDPCTGDISNQQILFNFTENGHSPSYDPDGMTIDNEGNLYAGTFRGSMIVVVNPKKGKVLEIPFPASQVSSAAFGGPNLDTLYVTTAAQNTTEMEAGYLYRIRNLGVHGFNGVKACV